MTFPVYETGTASVSEDSTLVAGLDTLWQRSNVREGDRIVIDPDAGTPEVTILAVNGPTQLTLAQPWKHGTKTGVPYKIIKGSIDRTVGVRSFKDIDDAISALNADGFYFFVPPDETAPDNSNGYDGQYARQPTTGKEWVKVDGAWVYRGLYAAFAIMGSWSVSVTYQLNQVVTRNGKAYYAKRETLNDPPEASPDDWAVLVENGDRYDIALYDTDRPASGEQITKWVAPTAVTFRASLSESKGRADVAAAANAVFSLRKNGVEFATMTFVLGASVATFVCATDTAFAPDDVLSIFAPFPRDATLAGVAATIVGYR
jgi:hypothetical protein